MGVAQEGAPLDLFQEFPKVARLNRDVVITEKIDGTNAQVVIVPVDWARDNIPADDPLRRLALATREGLAMLAGKRNGWVTPEADNFTFARWVAANAAALWALGEGRHYGEWWGSGIQRGYGLQKGEKRFSLFNVARWHAVGFPPYVMQGSDPRQPPKVSNEAPACCGVVPVLYRGPFSEQAIEGTLGLLEREGSQAVDDFDKPEGVVIFHTASGTLYKVTLEGDGEPKSARGTAAHV